MRDNRKWFDDENRVRGKGENAPFDSDLDVLELSPAEWKDVDAELASVQEQEHATGRWHGKEEAHPGQQATRQWTPREVDSDENTVEEKDHGDASAKEEEHAAGKCARQAKEGRKPEAQVDLELTAMASL